jgi:hypothetical protein
MPLTIFELFRAISTWPFNRLDSITYCAAVRHVSSSRVVRSQTLITPSPAPDATELREFLSWKVSALPNAQLQSATACSVPCTCCTRPEHGRCPTALGRASRTCALWLGQHPNLNANIRVFSQFDRIESPLTGKTVSPNSIPPNVHVHVLFASPFERMDLRRKVPRCALDI